MLAATALVSLLVAAPIGDCNGAEPSVDVAAVPARSVAPNAAGSKCRIVDARAATLLTAPEFVDVRAQPVWHAIAGARVLSFAQLEERPPALGVTRVLLGNGLDEDVLARQCRPRTAAQAVVLRGGVRAWHDAFSYSAMSSGVENAAVEDAHIFTEVSVTEALSASVRFVFVLKHDPKLVSLLEQWKLPYSDADSVNWYSRVPIVFVTDSSELPRRTIGKSWFYLRGGAAALRQALLQGRAHAQSAAMVLRRPCYLP